MDIIMSVVIAKVDTIKFKGQEYEVNPLFKKLCQKIFRFYVFLLAIILVLAVNVAPMIGADDFFSVILFALIMVLVYNVIVDFVVRKIIEKKAL